MDDKELRKIIIEALESEPSIDAAEIGVSVENAVVTLTGHVTNYEERHKAEQVAKSVRGVKAIAQEIEVCPLHSASNADDEIARRALSILAWDVMVPNDAIQVVVEHGWVTLTGAVDWQYQRKAAEDDIRKLSGVRGVLNGITIKDRPHVSDIKKKIEDALKRNAQVEANDIHIDIHDGAVTLKGKVQSWHERELLESAVWTVPGVKSIRDCVTVE